MKLLKQLRLLPILFGLTVLPLGTLTAASIVKPIIYVILKSQGNPFFLDIARGAADANKNEFDLRIRSGTKEGDVSGQIAILEGIADSSDFDQVRGIILTPSSSGPELMPSLRALRNKRAGIKIVLADTKIAASHLQAFQLDDITCFASDNREGGAMAAKLMAEKLSSKPARILIFTGVESQETAIERRDGFTEAYQQARPKDVFEFRSANWQRLEAQFVLSSLLSAGTRYDGIFAGNDEMALGAIQAYHNQQVERLPVIIGFDATDEARAAVKSGELAATIAQDPRQMGRAALQLIRSGSIAVPTVVVTQ